MAREISLNHVIRARLGLSQQGFSLELVSVAVWVLKQVGLERVLVEERRVVTLDGSRERDVPGRGKTSFRTYGGNGGRHMGKRGCVGELKKNDIHRRINFGQGEVGRVR